MGWIVPGSVKMCKGGKDHKEPTIHNIFSAGQARIPIYGAEASARLSKALEEGSACSNWLVLHKRKGQTWCTFSKEAITARLLENSCKFSFCSSHNGLQVLQIVLISPLLLRTMKILIFEFWPRQRCSWRFWRESRLKLCTYYVPLLENSTSQLWLHPTELKTTSLSVPGGW